MRKKFVISFSFIAIVKKLLSEKRKELSSLRVGLSIMIDSSKEKLFGWKDPSFTVATFSKVLCVNYHRFPSQSHWGVIIIPLRFSYALWRSQFTLLFGKVRKSEMRGSPQKCFISSLQPYNGLDFFYQNIYNKGTKFMCCSDDQSSGCQTHFLFNCQ